MKWRKNCLWLCILLAVTLSACSDMFDTHPYDVNFKGETGINNRQMAEIERRFADRDTLRIAFISDTHLWMSDARDEVADINHRADIDFVIHCGDLTDTGTTKEYEWSRDILGGLRYPFVALVGNHDFLGTGDQAYNVMYGAMDFSFIAARVKFVCLNTNATEYDYMAAVPNFDFMEEEFTKDSARFDRTVIVMHAPPYSDQFNNNVCKAFRCYLDFFPGYIPKRQSTRGKLTMTLKENYIPWNLLLSAPQNESDDFLKRGWTLNPLTASIYVNTVYGHEFWKSQPGRYPDKYYEFMSTKFRLNVAFGQRITWEIPRNRRKYAKSISLFYEVSSCDLYIRAKFQDSSIPLKDIIGLSLGVKLQTM